MNRSALWLVTLLFVSGSSQVAHADPIFLSGDGNITEGLSSTGNQQFFLKVLGSGNKVVIGAGSTIPFDSTQVNNFYNAQPGVSSGILAGPVSAADLTGAAVFFGILPSSDYTAAEIAALSDFLAEGGTVFFIGETGAFASANARINSVLLSLGSTMSIIPNSSFDFGFHTATGSQIAVDPFTDGVTSFVYAAPSQIEVGDGTAVFFGTGSQPFVAYEGAEEADVAAIPEPATWGLFGIVALATVFYTRRTPGFGTNIRGGTS